MSSLLRSPFARLLDFLILPKEISAFEARYLARMNAFALVFFAIHIPVFVVLAWFNGTKPLLALALSSAIVVGPAAARLTIQNPRTVSIVHGVTAMFMGGTLVHFGQGPVQIEMHFYFFALLACLVIFGNPVVIIAAAVTVALHHLLLWGLVPQSVFNYDAPVWVVGVHAAFVVLESVAACFIARSFFENVIGLERIVQQRTNELAVRNHDMRLVLDNTLQGLTTINADGVLANEYSRAFEQWFGRPEPGETIFDRMGKRAPDFAEASRFAWRQVVDGMLPVELTLDQMPSALNLGSLFLGVSYVPIGDAGDRYLVVISDETAKYRRECAEREQREAMCLFERMLSDRRGMLQFFEEADTLVENLTMRRADLQVHKRMLHTLKGNSAIFGLESIATLCHQLETLTNERGEIPNREQMARLAARWTSLASRFDNLLDKRAGMLDVTADEQAKLEAAVVAGAPHEELLPLVQTIRLEAVQGRFELFGSQIRRMAAGLEKRVVVKAEGNGCKLDPKQWSKFWSAFIHVARNAVDHGIETQDERASAGKPEEGTIVLRTELRGEHFIVEISDDGRGIDWGRVSKRAAVLGLATSSREDLQRALFSDGLSTAAEVTELSGRGVGMGAIEEATRALGGSITVESTLGTGTTIRMTFSSAAIHPKTARPVMAPRAA